MLWYMHIMDYYTTVKMNKLAIPPLWMNPKNNGQATEEYGRYDSLYTKFKNGNRF